MTQAAQGWIELLLGKGGLVGLMGTTVGVIGGLTGFLINQRFEGLKQEHRVLEQKNELLQEKLKTVEAEKKDVSDSVNDIITILEKLRESELNPDDAAKLRRFLGGFERIRSMKEKTRDFKAASQWLDYRKATWVEEASAEAIQKHPSLIPLGLKKRFRKDIEGYLNWAYTSLNVYEHPDAPLSNFVAKPALQSLFPYATAIRYLIDNFDRGDLTIEQSRYLESIFDELARKISDEFK